MCGGEGGGVYGQYTVVLEAFLWQEFISRPCSVWWQFKIGHMSRGFVRMQRSTCIQLQLNLSRARTCTPHTLSAVFRSLCWGEWWREKQHDQYKTINTCKWRECRWHSNSSTLFLLHLAMLVYMYNYIQLYLLLDLTTTLSMLAAFNPLSYYPLLLSAKPFSTCLKVQCAVSPTWCPYMLCAWHPHSYLCTCNSLALLRVHGRRTSHAINLHDH